MSGSFSSSAAAVGLGVAAVLVVVGGCALSRRTRAPPSPGWEQLKLMRLEQTSLILGIPSISTVTFFEGRPDVSAIRKRVAAIIRANPWLKGRLVKQSTARSPAPKSTGLFCRYPGTNKDDNDDDSLGEDSFTYSKNAAVRSSTQYNTLIKLLSKLVVKKGSQCVDRDESLFKVHVIVGEEDKEFAIIVSLSHIIADGSTFYSLYGMLSQTASVESLVAARFDGFEDKLKEMMRGNDTLKWVLSPGVIINIIRTLIFTPKVHFSLVDLDSRWIADEKRRLSTASSFVSTNDVLTSWYLSLLSNCDVGLMAMNFRNRMPEIGSEHAGNYEALLGLQKADMADAQYLDFVAPSLVLSPLSGRRLLET